MSNKDTSSATRREFVLYWAGFLVVVSGAVLILMTISGVLLDVLNSGCYYPIISPMMGVMQPAPPPQGTEFPYYCYNPMVAVIRFVFNLFAELIFSGAGAYMMLNGKKA